MMDGDPKSCALGPKKLNLPDIEFVGARINPNCSCRVLLSLTLYDPKGSKHASRPKTSLGVSTLGILGREGSHKQVVVLYRGHIPKLLLSEKEHGHP